MNSRRPDTAHKHTSSPRDVRAALAVVSATTLFAFACGAPVAQQPRPSAPFPAASPSAAPSATAQSAPAASASATAVSSATEAVAPEPVDTTKFPPDPFVPPQERTAREGDGKWTAAPGASAQDQPAVLVLSEVHPHPFKRFTSVALAAFDLRRVSVELVAGTAEPESSSVPAESRTGIVPSADLTSLLAVFNGGFQAKHGHYGMRIGNDLFIPAAADSCTVGLMRDGSVRIGTWSAIASHDDQMRAWRQTPPCLVEAGQVNPQIESAHAARKWGISIEGKLEIRRSAVGLDASGRTLLYGVGEEVTPADLAAAMRAAGAVDVAQLDINWSYTRFLVYGSAEGGAAPEVVHTLLPKMKYGRREYVSRPATRDFFYVTRRGQTK